ncbi:MAG: NADPH:quinone reductase [Microbacteriaceae bacterium]|nr:NADPH:quinone reductase [Microbacteriaceae bacterium]
MTATGMKTTSRDSIGRPGTGQVRVRFGALAFGLGGATSAAGTIDAVGEDAVGFVSGDRVAYWGGDAGRIAVRLVDVENLIGIPRGVSDQQAAALLPSGLAARTLVKEVNAVGGNDTVLVHAASTLLGSMTVAWAKALGATVIATVGSASGRDQAIKSGADDVIVFGEEDVTARVLEITGDRGIDIVYDGVGAATVATSLASLRRDGVLVQFGANQPRIDPQDAASKGVSILRAQLGQHRPGGSIQQGAADVFVAIRSGVFDGVPIARYPLSDSARALADLESRRVNGSVVLVPSGSRDSVDLAA